MLVLDEQLKDHHLIAAISAWYPGTVTHIQILRPATVVKDDNVATLLLTVHYPTFITINVDDFWRKIPPHRGYCILTIDLLQGDVDDLPAQLRRLFTNDKYTYRVTWSEEDGEYISLCVEFPSLSWLAATPEESLAGIHAVVADVVTDLQANGEPVPEPLAIKEYSGRFMVRIPPTLHIDRIRLPPTLNISLRQRELIGADKADALLFCRWLQMDTVDPIVGGDRL